MSEPLVANNVSPNRLPIIDVSGLSASKRERREAVGEAIRSACVNNGFFYIANHGVPRGLIDAAMAETRNFFDLPAEAKQQVAKSESKCNRGWEPLS
jgi:isopenicillin N synthase-like dioxygenase